MLERYQFQINAVLLNFLFISESWKKVSWFLTLKIIRNVSWAANEQITMISERLCDTKDQKFQLCHHIRTAKLEVNKIVWDFCSARMH